MTDVWAAHMRAQMCVPQREEFVMALFPETHRTQLVERHEIITEFDSLMTLAWREAVWARGEQLAYLWADAQGVGIEVERFTSFGPGDADNPSQSCGLIGVRWSVTIGRQPDEAQNWVWSARWFDWARRFMAMRGPSNAETP